MNQKQLSVILNVVSFLLVSFMLSSCAYLESNHKAGSDYDTVKIWFVKTESNELKLVPVTRQVAFRDKISYAVSELLSGPSQAERQNGLSSEIPKATILLDVKHKGHIVELNLSRRFALGGGIVSMETRLDQLSKTVASCAGEDKVYLSVEGQRLYMTSGDGIEVKQPLN